MGKRNDAKADYEKLLNPVSREISHPLADARGWEAIHALKLYAVGTSN